jgi:hypothetical protein
MDWSMDWSMDWNTVFAGLLVVVTGGLVWVGWRQIQDARVLQRAYVSALPGGVSTTSRGELLAHVAIGLRRLLTTRISGGLAIGIGVTTGSHGIGVPQPWTKYLYALGRITYADGFREERRTNFCHRYNTEVKEPSPGGGYLIRKEHGRHHEYGNDAN